MLEQAARNVGVHRRHHAHDRAAAIVGPRRGVPEIAERAAAIVAVGVIIPLLRVLRREFSQCLAGCFGIKQPKVLTRNVQLEVRVESGTRARRLPVFARSKHHQILPRSQQDRREGPLARIIRVIGQRPAREVHRLSARVPQFNPILEFVVFVLQSRLS